MPVSSLKQTRQMGWATLFLVSLLLVGSVHSEARAWDVGEVEEVTTLRTLDDTSFEHDTQAATGQTTGNWLILFTDSDCGACGDAETALLQVIPQLNHGLPIVAKVNISKSPRTAKRFNVEMLPQLKFFRDRHMFSYGGQWSPASIVTFIQDGWRSLPVEDVPKEATLTDEVQDMFWAIYRDILQYLGNRPGIVAILGSMIAMGGYVLTKKWLMRGQKKRRLRVRPWKRRAD